MNGVKELDTNFVFPEFFNMDELTKLPVYKHTYGESQEEDPTTLYWTEYHSLDPDLNEKGSISFVRKLYLEYPEVAQYIVDYLQTLFPIIEFETNRVSVLKTNGSINPHIDEAGRICCVNIGIKNSSAAVTRTSSTKDFEIFEKVASEVVCQDNHAYLLDTSSVHEVIGKDLTTDRFFFSYAFRREFNIVHSVFKRPHGKRNN